MVLGGQIVLTGDPFRHAKAQRLAPGEVFRAVLGETLYTANVEEVLADRLVASIGTRRRVIESRSRVHLYSSLLKGQGFDLVVEKATELGVASITPVVTRRTIPRPDAEKGAVRKARWEKVAKAASEQSGRGSVPAVHGVVLFKDLMAFPARIAGRRLLAYEHEGMTVDLAEAVSGASEASILIGPEGGLDAEEVQQALHQGFIPVSLGPYILKAETASLAAVSLLMHHLSKQA
jgi:16S rRNA (uracil1498-N3)-methyltransferase